VSRFYIELDGVDFTKAFNKWGMRYHPIKVEGAASGVSMGGSAIVDLLRVKDGITLRGNAVQEAVYRQLAAICSQAYVTASYEHPVTGNPVSKQMLATLSEANRMPMGSKVMFDGWSLTLEER